MAIQAQIRKDINEYQPKLFFGLSARQLVFSSLGVVAGIGTYFLLSKIVGHELAGYLVIALVAPLFALGFVKIDGQPFEAYLIKLYRFAIYPKARVYTSVVLHHPDTRKLVSNKKEQINAGRSKNQNTRIETRIKEYDVTARQRENAAAYKRIK
ncbi:MAG: PrgI family protein [Oscillospiraceae bacterium]|nr:PrgI family protein [Oscillospiraceae bacterium]